MRLPLALLCAICFPSCVAATESTATAAALVDGALVCSKGKQNTAKITTALAEAGWERQDSLSTQASIGMLTGFTRENARLMYFWSKAMTQCIVSADVNDAPVIDVVAALQARLGKAPKVETPGARYLFFLPRLDILTVQVKPDGAKQRVELSVVN